jgi:eukaryotic-like serine/threonine-protein kinase
MGRSGQEPRGFRLLVVIPAAKPGDIIDGRYAITHMIGCGAMADVFAADDVQSGQPVAVKILRAIVARNADAVERFRHEAATQARIEHRNVAQLHAVGLSGSKPFLVMELLRGRSLRTVLRAGGAVRPLFAASYIWQALQGLAATHAAGVLHRDLKPANLMLEDSDGPVERVVLIDFGFASLGVSTGLTQSGTVVGSLSYLAPERLRGEPSDGRADVYGMGVILWELLVGTPPFRGEEVEVIEAHLNRDAMPPSLANLDSSIPAAIDDVVLKALAKFPEDRYESASAMADALEAAVNEE